MLRATSILAVALTAMAACSDAPTTPVAATEDATALRADRLPLTKENLYTCSVVRLNPDVKHKKKSTVRLADSVNRSAEQADTAAELTYLTLWQFPQGGGQLVTEASCVVGPGPHERLVAYLSSTSGAGRTRGANRSWSMIDCEFDMQDNYVTCGTMTCTYTGAYFESKNRKRANFYYLWPNGTYDCVNEVASDGDCTIYAPGQYGYPENSHMECTGPGGGGGGGGDGDGGGGGPSSLRLSATKTEIVEGEAIVLNEESHLTPNARWYWQPDAEPSGQGVVELTSCSGANQCPVTPPGSGTYRVEGDAGLTPSEVHVQVNATVVDKCGDLTLGYVMSTLFNPSTSWPMNTATYDPAGAAPVVCEGAGASQCLDNNPGLYVGSYDINLAGNDVRHTSIVQTPPKRSNEMIGPVDTCNPAPFCPQVVFANIDEPHYAGWNSSSMRFVRMSRATSVSNAAVDAAVQRIKREYEMKNYEIGNSNIFVSGVLKTLGVTMTVNEQARVGNAPGLCLCGVCRDP